MLTLFLCYSNIDFALFLMISKPMTGKQYFHQKNAEPLYLITNTKDYTLVALCDVAEFKQ